jgi:hypothetical protein
MGLIRIAYKFWGKETIKNLRLRWEDNVQKALKGTECENVERVAVVQIRVQ